MVKIFCIYFLTRKKSEMSSPRVQRWIAVTVVIAIVILLYTARHCLFSSENYQTTTTTTSSPTPSCMTTTIAPFVTGMIMAWSGSVTSIPSGWVLCNGSNGTPDLRGRFVMGFNPSSTSTTLRSTGGEEKVTLTLNQIPKHSHRYSQGGHYRVCSGCNEHAVGDNPEERQVTKTANNTGNNQPHNNMPPYYVVAFIMKVNT